MKNKMEVDINLDNLVYNFEKLRIMTDGVDGIILTVKANAYNIGVYNVVDRLLKLKNPQKKFFVFAVEEGIELRLMFPNLEKIYIFSGITENDCKFFKKYQLIPVINSFGQLKLCKEYKINNIVLQFNTGMNRAGIDIKDIEEVKDFVEKNNICIDIVMSHLCCADDKNNNINKYQIENFKKIIKYFPDKTINKSLSASDGIINFELSDICNIHRPGLALYGYYQGLKPVYSIYSLVEFDGENLYLPFGIKNGITSDYGDFDNYVIINNLKIKIKSITLDKVILLSNDMDLIGCKAVILGGDISYQIFEKMCKTDIREVVARIISNCDVHDDFKINLERKRIANDDCINKKASFRMENGKLVEFHSTIIEKREILNDGIVGYGATANVNNGDKLAVFFGGYLDGLSRSISNKGCSVFVEDKLGNLVECPIIGKISMDQTIIKIPSEFFNNINIGSKVIIINNKCPAERFLYDKTKTLDELFFYIDKSSRVCDLSKK